MAVDQSGGDGTEDDTVEGRTARLNWRTATIGLVAGVLAVGVAAGGAVSGWISAAFGAPGATIVTPASATVPADFDLSGTYDDVPADEMLWAVTRAHSNNRWYPQDKPCVKLDDQGFGCGRYYVGGPHDRGSAFDIVIVAARSAAVNEFRRYDVEEKGSDPADPDPGLAGLPPGAEILARVTVTRE